ncbi:unnamed protein product [Sphagnum balticum]
MNGLDAANKASESDRAACAHRELGEMARKNEMENHHIATRWRKRVIYAFLVLVLCVAVIVAYTRTSDTPPINVYCGTCPVCPNAICNTYV